MSMISRLMPIPRPDEQVGRVVDVVETPDGLVVTAEITERAKRRKRRRPASPDPLPSVEQLHRLRAAGIDRAKQLDREADDLEARAYALRLEAFQLTNHARLAARHAPPGDG